MKSYIENNEREVSITVTKTVKRRCVNSRFFIFSIEKRTKFPALMAKKYDNNETIGLKLNVYEGM